MAEFITEEGKEIIGKFAKYDEVLCEFAKLLVPHLVDQMTAEIGKRIKADLTELDDERISEIVRAELQDCDFIDEDRAREIADEQIAEIDFEDQIDERCNYQGYLDDQGVREVLRNVTVKFDI